MRSADTRPSTATDGELARAIASMTPILGTCRLLAGSTQRKTRRREGEEMDRLADVAVRPGQREILNALPADGVRIRTEHAGAFERLASEP